jgi:hypothetical protein
MVSTGDDVAAPVAALSAGEAVMRDERRAAMDIVMAMASRVKNAMYSLDFKIV